MNLVCKSNAILFFQNPALTSKPYSSFPVNKDGEASKKSKSKRVTLKQKHKIIRKVKEHHKKKAKKLGLNKKYKEYVEKDPGIPNDWPFKEQELKALEARRARALEELEQKKDARKERAKKRKQGLVEDDDMNKLADMASGEQNFMDDRGNNDSTTFVKIRDNSERAFYKELVKVVEASDVILEVLDARDPLGTRSLDMEKMVMRAGPEKHLVLLLNKIDLVPMEAAEKWLKYLREELPTVAFKCSTQEQKSNLGWKDYKSFADNSLINSLKRSCVVNVGATLGLTRSMQEVHLDKNVKLLDYPGIVMLRSSSENDAAIALRNCKRIEKLDDPIGPVFDSVDDFLQKVSTVRGRLKKGGIVDIVAAAARIVLHDWNEGMNGVGGEHSEVKIVSELGKEFNVDEVYGSESSIIGSLKSVDFHPVEVSDNLEQPVTQSANETDKLVNDDRDDAMDAGEDDAGRTSGKNASSRQNEKLYTEEGMLNIDYFKKESIMDDAEDDVRTDECTKNRFELPSGNELDNE
ncbi:hypothetical protein K7X08_003415 [Anisodus acutangulus]|uniref:Uncharacterized protein n=1 Tax=Anisodus acutangulus TaxID=402998 RepID=A0A9Q1MFA3_9SOLA|nr:hypothetical protein K7X08_003415 [Anisodus acutangulus]